jgi:hypothetical protein
MVCGKITKKNINMKQLLSLFLFLVPCLAWAQYPTNGNQKITLGEQTTADGIIWRGVSSDTTLTAKSDTAAYFVLDTVNINLYTYKASATGRKWRQLGADTASIAYVNTYGTQTVNGLKTFTDTMRIEDAIKVGANNAYVYSAGTGNYYFVKNYKNQSGNHFIIIGDGTMSNATTVSNPTSSRVGGVAIGYNVMKNLSQSASTNNGVYNSGVGYGALESVTTGNFNTAFGHLALNKLTTGGSNAALGTSTLENATTTGSTLGIGDGALRFLTSGSDNVAIGSNAGTFDKNDNQLNTINQSVLIGRSIKPTATSTNEIILGYAAVGQGSNSIMLGNSSVTDAYCYDTSLSQPSDFRDKTNIENLQTGLDLIMNLRPVKFQWNMRDYGKVGYKDIGFIAQEALDVQNVNNEADNIKLVSDENQNQLSMQSANLIPILVKAIQDQQAQIELLKQRLLILENK